MRVASCTAFIDFQVSELELVKLKITNLTLKFQQLQCFGSQQLESLAFC